MSKQHTLQALLDIMARLRDPEHGCPWDQEQDFKSIVPYTLEEAYEVADAIERNDLVDLKDELGDLLLQVVFHSQLAKEAGQFDFSDVVNSISDKMLRRHPHVFSDAEVSDAAEQTRLWDRLKAEERIAKGKGTSDSILADIPVSLPGLTRARKLTQSAAKVGFDWPDAQAVFAKVDEELQELQDAVAEDDYNHIEEEYGDLLFALANLARHLDLDSEKAIRRANQKFISRFQAIEQIVREQGRKLDTYSLYELDQLWNLVKDRNIK